MADSRGLGRHVQLLLQKQTATVEAQWKPPILLLDRQLSTQLLPTITHVLLGVPGSLVVPHVRVSEFHKAIADDFREDEHTAPLAELCSPHMCHRFYVEGSMLATTAVTAHGGGSQPQGLRVADLPFRCAAVIAKVVQTFVKEAYPDPVALPDDEALLYEKIILTSEFTWRCIFPRFLVSPRQGAWLRVACSAQLERRGYPPLYPNDQAEDPKQREDLVALLFVSRVIKQRPSVTPESLHAARLLGAPCYILCDLCAGKDSRFCGQCGGSGRLLKPGHRLFPSQTSDLAGYPLEEQLRRCSVHGDPGAVPTIPETQWCPPRWAPCPQTTSLVPSTTPQRHPKAPALPTSLITQLEEAIRDANEHYRHVRILSVEFAKSPGRNERLSLGQVDENTGRPNLPNAEDTPTMVVHPNSGYILRLGGLNSRYCPNIDGFHDHAACYYKLIPQGLQQRCADTGAQSRAPMRLLCVEWQGEMIRLDEALLRGLWPTYGHVRVPSFKLVRGKLPCMHELLPPTSVLQSVQRPHFVSPKDQEELTASDALYAL